MPLAINESLIIIINPIIKLKIQSFKKVKQCFQCHIAWKKQGRFWTQNPSFRINTFIHFFFGNAATLMHKWPMKIWTTGHLPTFADGFRYLPCSLCHWALPLLFSPFFVKAALIRPETLKEDFSDHIPPPLILHLFPNQFKSPYYKLHSMPCASHWCSY